MISYLNGKIILKKDKFIVLEVNNIGYKVFLSKKTLSNISSDADSLKVFCYQNVGESILDLYGFLSYDELEFFEILLEIHGVGPKAALEISALGPLDKIKDKILKQDEKIFEEIPGIGSKKAMTIILELTGKIKLLDGVRSKSSSDPAEDALMQLGFSRSQSKEALDSVSRDVKNMEERVKLALKNLGK